MFTEAEDILSRFKGKNQMVSYYLGYIRDKKYDKTNAEKFFKAASDQSVDYGFPFRLEDVKVLNLALKYHPDDSRPYYYLGNLLFDKQPGKAIENWENAVKREPSLAIAWRNLGWVYFQYSHDLTKAINAYEKAISLKDNDPVYYAELDPLYEKNNTPIEKRSKLFTGKNEVAKLRDDSFVREIIVLNLAGEYEKSAGYLSQSNFHFREGSSRVRDITVDAYLLLGKKFLAERKYDQALQQLLLINKTSDNSDSDKGTVDMRTPQINYFIGLAYEALGKKAQAKTYFSASSNQPIKEASYIRYYQGLSYLKLGNKAKASEYFNSLIEAGSKQLTKGSEIDFFAKFGETESGNVQLSNAYLLKGLGYKGLNDNKTAIENLKKALELSASNLYARVELE
jgi:tetratricopeptide (TPR) repeat protein